ncbi:MAG TPA: transglutaminase-like cysteine peptidase [Burkholderiales bacterium]|nr:transglutaminase-like cysteine peptidase [Burkholderiales bacterium]
MLTGLVFAAGGELGFSRSITPGLMDYMVRHFGQGARGRLEGWKEFVRSTAARVEKGPANSSEADLLRPVNGFFNRLPSITDLVHWGVEDYWATPAEFLASNGGDCEDYAIAKYFALKELGVPVSRLRMVYAQTWRADGAHMVLAYYPSPGAEPLILDNLEGSIQPASERPDLMPVYTFNDDDLTFSQKGGLAVRFDAQSIRKWREVLDKLARELTY